MKRAPASLLPLLALAVFTSAARAESGTEAVANNAADSAALSLHPIIIENPPTLGRLTTGLRDAAGRRIGIDCTTCHGASAGGGTAMAALPETPDDFHAGIELVHGNLVCDSCVSKLASPLRGAVRRRLPLAPPTCKLSIA